MKIEFLAHYKARHGYTLKDRLIARLPDYAACGEPRAVARQPAQPRSRRARRSASAGSACRRSAAADVAPRHLLARARPALGSRAPRRRSPPRAGAKAGASSSSTPSTASSRARTRSPRRACCRPPATRVHTLAQGAAAISAAAAPFSPRHGRRGEGDARRAARRAAAVRRARHRHRRPRAVVPADAARRERWRWASATRRRRSRAQALLFEEFIAREAQAGRFALALRAGRRADPGPRPLPPEGVRRGRRRSSTCCASFPAPSRR